MLFVFFVLRAQGKNLCIAEKREECPFGFDYVDRWGWEGNATDSELVLFISNSENLTAICELRKMNLTKLSIRGDLRKRSVVWLDIAHTNGTLEELDITDITVVVLDGMAPVSGKYRATRMTLMNCSFVNAVGFEACNLTMDPQTASSLRLTATTTFQILDWVNAKPNSQYALTIESPLSNGTAVLLDNLTDVNATLWKKGMCLKTRNNVTVNMTLYGSVLVVQRVVQKPCWLNLSHTFAKIEDGSQNDWTAGTYRFICHSSVPVNISLLQRVNFLWGMRVPSVHISSVFENAKLYLKDVRAVDHETLCEISSSQNITAVLDRIPMGTTVFHDGIRLEFDNHLAIDWHSNVNCSDLTFLRDHTYIDTLITNEFSESRWIVHHSIEQRHVHWMPMWDPNVDISALATYVNKTAMAICAPSLDCSMYDIQEWSYAGNDTPFGFRDDSMAFGVRCGPYGTYQCVAMVLETNPLDFFTEVCVYNDTSDECRQGTNGWKRVQNTGLEEYLSGLSNNSLSMMHLYFAANVKRTHLRIAENFPTVTDLRISSEVPRDLTLLLTNQLVRTVSTMTLNNTHMKLEEPNSRSQTSKMNLTTLNLSRESVLDETSMDLVDVTDVYIDFNDYHRKYTTPPWPCQNVFLTGVQVSGINHTNNGWDLLQTGSSESVALNASSSKTICLAVSNHDRIAITKRETGPVWPLCLDFIQSGNRTVKLAFDNTWNATDLAIQVFTDSNHEIEIESSTIVPVNFSEKIMARKQARRKAELRIGKTQSIVNVTCPLVIGNDVVQSFFVNASGSDIGVMVFPNITVASDVMIAGNARRSMLPKALETDTFIVMNSTEAIISYAKVNKEVVIHPGARLMTGQTDYQGTRWTFQCLPELQVPMLEYDSDSQWDSPVTNSEDVDEHIPDELVIVYPDRSRTKMKDLNQTFIEEAKALVCAKSFETCYSIMNRTSFSQNPVVLRDATLKLALTCNQDKFRRKTCMYMTTEITLLTTGQIAPAIVAALVVCCIIAVSGIVLLVLMLKWYRSRANMESTIKEALLEPPRNL